MVKLYKNINMKKGLAYTFLGLGFVIFGYSAYLLVKNFQTARIDSKTVTVEEALNELEKSK